MTFALPPSQWPQNVTFFLCLTAFVRATLLLLRFRGLFVCCCCICSECVVFVFGLGQGFYRICLAQGKCYAMHVTHTHTRLTLQVMHLTSHVTRHTSHVTRHTSHVTRHTSHVTGCTYREDGVCSSRNRRRHLGQQCSGQCGCCYSVVWVLG